MALTPFKKIIERAQVRKQGALNELLPEGLSSSDLGKIGDDRYLARMTQCVFNAGFNWKVIEKKWGGFEDAFHGFNIGLLLTKSPQEWEAYLEDERIVRNWQKIQTIYKNAEMVADVAQEHGSFATFFSTWPQTDQIGLMDYLKKNGARLGGQTAQYFIRFMGKDGFVTSNDVITALIANGVEISTRATSQRDRKAIQQAFNQWHQETGMPLAHISRTLAYSVGENNSVETIKAYTSKD